MAGNFQEAGMIFGVMSSGLTEKSLSCHYPTPTLRWDRPLALYY